MTATNGRMRKKVSEEEEESCPWGNEINEKREGVFRKKLMASSGEEAGGEGEKKA